MFPETTAETCMGVYRARYSYYLGLVAQGAWERGYFKSLSVTPFAFKVGANRLSCTLVKYNREPGNEATSNPFLLCPSRWEQTVTPFCLIHSRQLMPFCQACG